MSKKIMALAVLATAPLSVSAKEAMNVKVGGYVDTMYGQVWQKDYFQGAYNDSGSRTGSKNSGAIFNDTKIKIEANAVTGSGLKYGGLIRLNADTSDSGAPADRTMIFVESAKLGRVEMGSYKSASSGLEVSAKNLGVATGGIDGKVEKFLGKGPQVNGRDNGNRFIRYPAMPIDCECVSVANKVTYYTPKIHGAQAGISYTSDTQMIGTVNAYNQVNRNSDGNFKDIINYGLTYENKIQKVGYKVGLIGEHGKAKGFYIARKDLNIWQLGTELSYQDFKVAGSYSDWGKSASPVIKDPKAKYGAHFWTLGAQYTKGAVSTSVTYLNSKKANGYLGTITTANTATQDPAHNKFENLVWGIDYKLAPGFTPHAEVARIKTRDASAAKSPRANVVLVGAKVTF